MVDSHCYIYLMGQSGLAWPSSISCMTGMLFLGCSLSSLHADSRYFVLEAVIVKATERSGDFLKGLRYKWRDFHFRHFQRPPLLSL